MISPMLKTCYDVSDEVFVKFANYISRFDDFFQYLQVFMMNGVAKMIDLKNLYDKIEEDMAA